MTYSSLCNWINAINAFKIFINIDDFSKAIINCQEDVRVLEMHLFWFLLLNNNYIYLSIKYIKVSFRYVVAILLIIAFGCQNKSSRTLLFVGHFTDKVPGKGIKIYDFNLTSGKAELIFELDTLTNSSFLRVSHNGKYLYSVLDSQMEYNGKVAAFRIDSVHGSIAFLNIRDCKGRNPVHLELDKADRFLVNSNYTDPSISLFKINSDGSLSESIQTMRFQGSSVNKERQKGAHIHSCYFSPNDEYLFAQDLGSDKIYKIEFYEQAFGQVNLKKDSHLNLVPGSGPRHFTFHPYLQFAYSVSELGGKVNAYCYLNDNLEFMEEYRTYKEKDTSYRAADIHITLDGKFLYVSNRGGHENSITIFKINQRSGALDLIDHEPTFGEHPRNFAIDPSGKFLLVANQFSNNIVIFRRDKENGRLIKLPEEIITKSPSSLQIRTYRMQ